MADETYAGAYTHLVKYDGGVQVSEIGGNDYVSRFAAPLRRFNGRIPWAIVLAPLPPRMRFSDMLEAGVDSTEYLQAAGSSPQTITVEIRKPGGQQWGAEWVRYVIGHAYAGDEPIDVPIVLPNGTHMVGSSEVFDADEATELFNTYYKTGDIPSGYALRPVEGYTLDRGSVELHGKVET